MVMQGLVSISNNELKEIKGGLSITGALIDSLIKAGRGILNVGRSFGVSLRAMFSKKKFSCYLR